MEFLKTPEKQHKLYFITLFSVSFPLFPSNENQLWNGLKVSQYLTHKKKKKDKTLLISKEKENQSKRFSRISQTL